MIRGGLVTLFVRDLERSIRFYVETMGMKLVEHARGGSAVVDAGDGFRIGLQQGRDSGGSPLSTGGAFAPAIGLYAKVPLREAIAIFENRGVVFDVTEEGPIALAHFKDLDGNRLYLCQE